MTGATNAKQSLTLANTAPGEGMFTGVAVELDDGNPILTTLPVVPVDGEDGSGIDGSGHRYPRCFSYLGSPHETEKSYAKLLRGRK